MGSSPALVRKRKLISAAIQLAVLFMVPLFGGAGTLAWRPGWVFLTFFFGFVASLTAWLFRHDPRLLDERLTPVRPDQKLWDKVLMGGQTVVSSGPYAVVRHPMYATVVVLLVGTALLLGSWWGLAAGALVILGMARRAVLEERVLAAELPGYAAYMRRVRFRFLPWVW
jgi:protein-S-isoprenylcysteine O-methyltransferase Ste14